MYYVYMLLCSDNTLYTGITNNLDNRLKVHNDGKGAKYTRCRLPVKYIYQEVVTSKSDALKREYAIKKLDRNKKFLLIDSEFNILK